MLNITKAVTCHAGARDGYYLSSALNEVNSLEALVTDFYTPDILSHVIKGRHSTKLPSAKTISLRSNLLRQRVNLEVVFVLSLWDKDRALLPKRL